MPTIIKAIAIALASVLLASGCATPARVEQMTAAPATLAAVPDGLRQNIAIRDVTGGQETNPLWTSQVSSAEFERAMEASLKAANLLQVNRQSGRFMLTAQLSKLEQPFVGLNMTVTATVLYQLVERSTGKTIWEKTLVTPYTAQFGDALIGVERLKLANEGAIRTNITELINQLLQIRT